MKQRILFVCHGNICRSPMAEFVMKHLAAQARRSDQYEIASAATSTEEIGNPVYPPVRQLLAEMGIACQGKRARQITAADYAYYDRIFVMDKQNLHNLLRMLGGDPAHKVQRLMDLTTHPGEVADPWYTRDFHATYRDILEACECLLAETKG